MEELRQHLQRRSLQDHQRVLALTFMHGSRRRLDARLWEMEGGHRRWFEAATVDSFAWRIVQRWRALARARGYEVPGERQYNQTCALGAALLERPEVSSWVAATCPVVIIDEAQDLNDARSRMVAALARNCDVFLAFDDFQCLNPALLPIAVREWLGEHFSAPVRRAVIDQVTAKTAQGRASAYVYWFTRRTSVLGGRPRAFHCAELPFVFDNTYLAAYPDREEQEARGAYAGAADGVGRERYRGGAKNRRLFYGVASLIIAQKDNQYVCQQVGKETRGVSAEERPLTCP